MKLFDNASGEELDVVHAVPSGKVRVQFSELTGELKVNEKQKALVERIMLSGGDSKEAMVEMLKEGTLSIDDLLDGGGVDPKEVEATAMLWIKLFRVACDMRTLKTDWKARILNDEWMMEQNISDIEVFVSSFRHRLGV